MTPHAVAVSAPSSPAGVRQCISRRPRRAGRGCRAPRSGVPGHPGLPRAVRAGQGGRTASAAHRASPVGLRWMCRRSGPHSADQWTLAAQAAPAVRDRCRRFDVRVQGPTGHVAGRLDGPARERRGDGVGGGRADGAARLRARDASAGSRGRRHVELGSGAGGVTRQRQRGSRSDRSGPDRSLGRRRRRIRRPSARRRCRELARRIHDRAVDLRAPAHGEHAGGGGGKRARWLPSDHGPGWRRGPKQ